MSAKGVAVKKPGRFDNPFDPHLSDRSLERILGSKLFTDLDSSRFPDSLTIEDIARNDTRLVHYRRGDIMMRQGDYGNSAYYVLSGSFRIISAPELTQRVLGIHVQKPHNFFDNLKRIFTRSPHPEYRHVATGQTLVGTRRSDRQMEMRAYIQDVESVISAYESFSTSENDLMGEIAALSRNPRMATVFAETEAMVIEIRWQGLRDLMRRDPKLRESVFNLYRERGLAFHLKSCSLFHHLDDTEIAELAKEARFESYGDLYQTNYRKGGTDIAETRLDHEPLITGEGEYVNSLAIICSGFVRESAQVNFGHRTISYLGKGQTFGLREIFHNHRHSEKVPMQRSYRAVGFTDLLWIPVPAVERLVIPRLKKDHIPEPIVQISDHVNFLKDIAADQALEEGLMEFLVDERYHNGTAAMVINLDRCTGCDDCVRACAAAHDNNPRFLRNGKRFGNFQVASACMHCLDPTCMIGCPTGAIHRSGERALVEINPMTCIGCSSCANNCSYNNIRMVPIRDRDGQLIMDLDTAAPMVQATKCDLCAAERTGPACQHACPHDALKRVDMRNLDVLSEWGQS